MHSFDEMACTCAMSTVRLFFGFYVMPIAFQSVGWSMVVCAMYRILHFFALSFSLWLALHCFIDTEFSLSCEIAGPMSMKQSLLYCGYCIPVCLLTSFRVLQSQLCLAVFLLERTISPSKVSSDEYSISKTDFMHKYSCFKFRTYLKVTN